MRLAGPLAQRLEGIPVAPCRRVLFVYLATLTVGTHWPALDLGGPAGIPLDKVLHVTAFGGLTVLLMSARWRVERENVEGPRFLSVGNVVTAAVLALVWATVDELTQGMPGLARHAQWDDYFADMAGIGMAVVGAVVAGWSAGGERGGIGRARKNESGPPPC